MTNEGMWKEIELADKLKEAKAELKTELKRYKREVDKLRKIIDILETDLSVKEYENRQLRERLKNNG